MAGALELYKVRSPGGLRYKRAMSRKTWRRVAPLFGLAALLGVQATGCGHAPVRPWQRAHLARRSMQFDDGLEGRFRQHMFGAREGADGGFGHAGGGCGCN